MSLLIHDKLVDVPGLNVVPPASHGGPAWNRLDTGDYTSRRSRLQIITPHTTGGRWPQPVIPGAGPPGHARQILDMWSGRDGGNGHAVHSGAQVVVDFDGVIYCAGDIMYFAAYHAEMINARSVGIEMCTRPDGGIYQATLDATALLIAMLAWSGRPGSGLLDIPAQLPRGPYCNEPLRRLEVDGKQSGGDDVTGVIGHRWQTSNRGRGDPGDELERILIGRYEFETVDYDAHEDLELARARQAYLNSHGGHLAVDGLAGPASLAEARRQGFARWSLVPTA